MDTIYIEDFRAEALQVFLQPTELGLKRWFEPKPGLLMAESDKVIARALRAGFRPYAALAAAERLETAPVQAVLEQLRLAQCPIYVGEECLLRELRGYALTSGLLCAMYREPLPRWQSLAEGAKRLAVLEEVVNPANLGAIFRSAAALGIDAVLLSEGCTDPFYRRAMRVSMGTVFQVPWAWVPQEEWPCACLSELRQAGFQLAAMALGPRSKPLNEAGLSPERPIAVLMGTEGEGLRPETLDLCEHRLVIPMSAGVDSLNVAAASAVVFWELRKRTAL